MPVLRPFSPYFLHRFGSSSVGRLPSILRGNVQPMAPNTSDEQPTSAEPLPQLSANIVPHHVWWLVLDIAVASSSKNIRINFLPSQLIRLLAHISPSGLRRWSFRFCPPVCCQLSSAGTSSLLRIHLPPYTALVSLELPLEPPYPHTSGTM